MKKILMMMLVLTIAGAQGAEAQNSYIGKSDPNARAVLKKVTAKYKSYKTLSGNISLTVENAQGTTLFKNSGTVDMKGNKYLLKMGDDVSFSDGSNIYNYDKGAKEIQITRVNPADNTLTPQKLFTDFYEKDFLYKLNGESKKGNRTVQEIELTPVDKTQPYFKVLLDVDKASSNILGAQVFEKNGNKYTYNISSLKTNQALPDSRFAFNQSQYPGVEIIDLR